MIYYLCIMAHQILIINGIGLSKMNIQHIHMVENKKNVL
jgi:hypothetical protein